MENSLETQGFHITASGRRLKACRIGDLGAGTTLVFLHEGLGSIAQWRDFPEALCRTVGITGLIYDRLGYGGSDPLPEKRRIEYLHEEAFNSLPEVLQRCGIRKAFLVGHSDGGSIALLFAAVHPEMTAGVITEAAHVFVEDVTIAGIEEAVRAYEKGGLKEKLARYHGENTGAAFWGWADTWLCAEFRNWNLEEYLPLIMAPILAIQGRDDPYGTPAQVEAITSQSGGPSKGLIISNCGHIPHIEARQEVLSAMADFISGLCVSS